MTTIRIDDLPATDVLEAIILAVAQTTDIDPLDVPPLGENLNPLALKLRVDDESFSGEVTFEFEDRVMAKCGLIAEERNPGSYYGFWTYDPAIIDEIVAYLEAEYGFP